MAVAALYYGLGGVAVMILLIMVYIAYASYFVFTQLTAPCFGLLCI